MPDKDRERGTSTSRFGVGRREAHDASDFYERFEPPVISDDDDVSPRFDVAEPCVCGDIRERDDIPDNSVALVVTSPPYFAGKQYEEELGRDGVPSSYNEYRAMLRSVFAACVRKLEPGGRIAVNVANLGRKPYRSLSADVIGILQDDLGLLLRGEVIWKKGDGAGGNCAWGSFKSPANPVLRDITERIIVASKGRFDRARSAAERRELGLPHSSPIWADAFMDRTLDVWEIPPESATRVGHPAPFPIELPKWLIELYTYEDDLVLDPFLGSGSTVIAAERSHRRGIGYDLDPEYVALARTRVADDRKRRTATSPPIAGRPITISPPPAAPVDEAEDFQARATREGKAARAVAEQLLTATGFEVIARNVRIRGTGATVNFVAVDATDEKRRWWFDVSGAFGSSRGGLLRTDTVWKSLGRASVLHGHPDRSDLILLSSDVPKKGTEGDRAIRASRQAGGTVFDVIGMLDPDGFRRLAAYAQGLSQPLPGYWTARELDG